METAPTPETAFSLRLDDHPAGHGAALIAVEPLDLDEPVARMIVARDGAGCEDDGAADLFAVSQSVRPGRKLRRHALAVIEFGERAVEPLVVRDIKERIADGEEDGA